MVEERNLNAALATSALPGYIDHEAIECIEQWLETFEPPKYFFPIDQALAKKGGAIYARYCAECHGRDGRNFEGKYVGFVTHIDEIGTDRYRLDNYTETLALNMATTYAEQKRNLRPHACPGGTTYQPPQRPAPAGKDPGEMRLAAVEKEDGSYRYKHYRKTYGYANMPLDGVWLRAPYLHNGSVPTLRDLLEPGKNRPVKFYRGNDLYDPKNVGFVSTESQDKSGKAYFLFDTTIPGNGNKGHEGRAYGTELRSEEKEALLEYLKTF
jgi:cytochrome c peroxidase